MSKNGHVLYFKGKAVFKLSSTPACSRLEGKQATFPVVEPTEERYFHLETGHHSLPQHLQSRHFATEDAQGNFRRMLAEFGGDKADEKSALEAHKKAVVQQLQVLDPTTGQPYVHDICIELPTFWIRIHYVQPDRQFSPKDQELPGLGDEQFTMIVDSEAVDTTGNWRLSGDILLHACVGATFFSKKDLEKQEIQTLRLRSPKDFQDPRVPLKMKYLSTI